MAKAFLQRTLGTPSNVRFIAAIKAKGPDPAAIAGLHSITI